MEERRPSIKPIWDALTEDSSTEGCSTDWRARVLERARPEDVKRVRRELASGRSESETASRLEIWPR